MRKYENGGSAGPQWGYLTIKDDTDTNGDGVSIAIHELKDRVNAGLYLTNAQARDLGEQLLALADSAGVHPTISGTNYTAK